MEISDIRSRKLICIYCYIIIISLYVINNNHFIIGVPIQNQTFFTGNLNKDARKYGCDRRQGEQDLWYTFGYRLAEP